MAMDSLDVVEAVMLIEEIFRTEIPESDANGFGSPSELVDWLELHFSNQRPNEEAAALLKKIAKSHNNPALAEGLDGTWRWEQIAAVVSEIFPSFSKPNCLLIFIRKLLLW
jgi:hypothetical protein